MECTCAEEEAPLAPGRQVQSVIETMAPPSNGDQVSAYLRSPPATAKGSAMSGGHGLNPGGR